MKKTFPVLIAVALSVVAPAVFAASAFRVHNYYSDHMVLQRDQPIRLSGEAMPTQSIIAELNGVRVRGIADERGRWVLEWPAMKAGGPYEIKFVGPTELVFSDVMIGDVWVASGQSNMQYFLNCGNEPYYKYPDGEEEINSAHDEGLRVFYVQPTVNIIQECTDFPGRPEWRTATSHQALDRFSCLAYFFGKQLRAELENQVAVGVIDASWGGTCIEPWIPATEFAKHGYTAVGDMIAAQRLLSRNPSEEEKREVAEKSLAKLKDWVDNKFMQTAPEKSAEALANWAKVEYDDTNWERGRQQVLFPGVAWFRIEFNLPEAWVGAKLKFHMDYVNDCDETFFEGRKIGETGVSLDAYWQKNRDYPCQATVAGKHVIAVRVQDHYCQGEIGGKAYLINIDSGEQIVFDDRSWRRKEEFRIDEAKIGFRPAPPQNKGEVSRDCQTPTTLFNAMIHPAVNSPIRGVIWYQGCSNAAMGTGYAVLQKMLIDGWREAFKCPEMTFLITQLSAFQAHRPYNRLSDDFWKDLEPKDCLGFATCREGQDLCHTYPRTGVACTIDIGDHSDIHPWNKPEVARRLANEAMRIAYGDEKRLAGPRAILAQRAGSEVRISFKDVGQGLELRGSKALNPHLVALAGGDGVFHWGEGRLEGNTLIVSSEEVAEPKQVQYCYSGFPPEPNLYRMKDGFPVFPFNLLVQ